MKFERRPVHCCFKSTQKSGLLGTGAGGGGGGEPRTATSTFTQLLSSEPLRSGLLYVHRDSRDYKGRGARDGHLDVHTAPEL